MQSIFVHSHFFPFLFCWLSVRRIWLHGKCFEKEVVRANHNHNKQKNACIVCGCGFEWIDSSIFVYAFWIVYRCIATVFSVSTRTGHAHTDKQTGRHAVIVLIPYSEWYSHVLLLFAFVWRSIYQPVRLIIIIALNEHWSFWRLTSC